MQTHNTGSHNRQSAKNQFSEIGAEYPPSACGRHSLRVWQTQGRILRFRPTYTSRGSCRILFSAVRSFPRPSFFRRNHGTFAPTQPLSVPDFFFPGNARTNVFHALCNTFCWLSSGKFCPPVLLSDKSSRLTPRNVNPSQNRTCSFPAYGSS